MRRKYNTSQGGTLGPRAMANIDKGIQARLRRDLPAVLRICQSLRRGSHRTPLSPWELAHLELLELSTPRFEVDLEARMTKIRHIGERLTAAERNQSYLFLYEMSGFMLHSRLYGAALEFAVQAEAASHDFNGWLSAHLNALVCREALGLEISREIQSVEQKLKKIRLPAVNPKSLSELELLRLRWHFRHGRFGLIEKSRRTELLYYWWLRQLPQVKWTSSAPKFKLQPSHLRGSYSQFDLNTILFRCEAGDLVNPAINHWCDRLYLWTWCWALTPDRVPLSHLWWLLEGFEFERMVTAMTMEDKIMVYHALSLLAARQARTPTALKLALGRLSPLRYEQFPFLKQELLQIESLRRRWRAKGQSSSGKILVDVDHGRLEGPHRQWEIMSVPVATALALLLRTGETKSVSLDEFVREVFQLPVFDSLIHYRKVYNLLMRLKNLEAGGIEFHIRNPVIHFEINPRQFHLKTSQSTPGIEQNRWQRLARRLQDSSTKDLPAAERPKQPESLTSLFLVQTWCSRTEIQKANGWSKSMANRQIRELVQRGILVSRGRGRSVRYTQVSH